ncbi:hypothetical protein [Kaarinaea lacus]
MKERRSGADRRCGEDRRSWECQLDFPYVDSHGTLVVEDRRKLVERRMAYAEHVDGDRRMTLNKQKIVN